MCASTYEEEMINIYVNVLLPLEFTLTYPALGAAHGRHVVGERHRLGPVEDAVEARHELVGGGGVCVCRGVKV